MKKRILCIFMLVLVLLVNLTFLNTTKASRFNMSYLYGNYNYTDLVSRTGNSLNEVSPSYFDLHTSGNLKLNKVDTEFVKEMHLRGIQVVPFLSNHWNRETGRNALKNIEALTTQIAEAIQKYELDGINVDIENVTEVDRENYTLFVKTLRQKLGNEKVVSVAVAANPYHWQTGWHASYDYAGLAQYADYLMLMTYDEHYEGGTAGPVASIQFVEKSIQYALEQVAPEKIVLGIPFFGRYWQNGASYGGYGVSLSRIESLLKKYKNSITYDEESQSVKAIITISSSQAKPMINGKTLYTGTYTFWYENEASMSAKLALVNQYHLKGTGSWSLGQETADTWNYYEAKLNQGLEVKVPTEETEANLKPSDWAIEAIAYVKANGWMKGKTESEFYPKDKLTRAEFATILERVLSLEKKEEEEKDYSDTRGHWAENSISAVTVNGYMQGYEDGRFQPEKNITREEVATVFSKLDLLSQRMEKNVIDEEEKDGIFRDMKVTDWSYQAVSKMAQFGILKGYENGNFEPKKDISREEMAVILRRAF